MIKFIPKTKSKVKFKKGFLYINRAKTIIFIAEDNSMDGLGATIIWSTNEEWIGEHSSCLLDSSRYGLKYEDIEEFKGDLVLTEEYV